MSEPARGMEYVKCNLCGHDETRLRFLSTLPEGARPQNVEAFRCTSPGYGLHHTIVECLNCGLVYTNPRFGGDEILDSYVAVEDPLYMEERDGRVLTFERHLRPLEKIKAPPGKLLDVGAYTGVFVEIAAQHGWDACGVEPSRWAVEQARERGLHMIEGTMATSGLDDGSLDVVTMWDVIEHVPDPFGEMQQAWRLLKPGGLLVVHTMAIDSLFARVMGGRWPWLMEMHIFYFSHRTLRKMLEQAGFTVISVTPQGRYLRLGYFATRIGGFSPLVGRVLGRVFGVLRLREMPVPLNFGDLVTAYAIKT
jgi:2-polyprenyl-3-methyl-5-hydroxy-6-metoxy-1,4-benzoquinol methylase